MHVHRKQFKEKALVEVMCCEIWYYLFNREILNSVFKVSKVSKQVLHMTHGLQFGHPFEKKKMYFLSVWYLDALWE